MHYKRLKTLVSIVAVASLLMFPFPVKNVFAGALSSHSITLSSSTPGATATHTISFTNTSTTAIKTVYLKYCTAAGAYGDSCTAPSGLVLPASNGVTLSGFSSNTNTAVGSSNIETVTITTPGGTETAQSHTVAIAGVTNPNAGVFYIRVYTASAVPATLDVGTTSSATIAAVTVSGTMLESMSFSVAAGTTGCGHANSSNITVDATTVGFGTLTGLTQRDVTQNVTLATNAAHGLNVKMMESGLLTNQSDDSKTIADFGGSSDAAPGTAWTDGSSAGFGVCASGTAANTTAFNTTTPYRYLAITNGSAKTIASSTAPLASGTLNVNYRIAIDPASAAGTYTNTVYYYVTPTF